MIWSQMKMYLLNTNYVDALYLIWLKVELLIACLAFLEASAHVSGIQSV